MYKNKKIAVSIPCYNEERFIRKTIIGLPKYIDTIYITDDFSKDKSKEIILTLAKKNKKINFVQNNKNTGNGYSVLRGLKQASKDNQDIVCIFAGDNQMDSKYLTLLLDECINNNVDLVKGNRFAHLNELKKMPKIRIVGNIIITLIAKIATGYWSMADPLNGYTALKIKTFKNIDSAQIALRYDYEASLLIQLSLVNAKIKDISIPAKYGEEKSDIKLIKDSFKILATFTKGFFKRLFIKYTLTSLNPIALFYFCGIFLSLFGSFFGLYVAINSIGPKSATTATVMLSVIPFIIGVQFILQAIILDIQAEPK